GRPGWRLAAGNCERGSTGSTSAAEGYAVPGCQGTGVRGDPSWQAVSLRVAISPSTTNRQERVAVVAALSTTSGPMPAGSPMVTPIRGSIVRIDNVDQPLKLLTLRQACPERSRRAPGERRSQGEAQITLAPSRQPFVLSLVKHVLREQVKMVRGDGKSLSSAPVLLASSRIELPLPARWRPYSLVFLLG